MTHGSSVRSARQDGDDACSHLNDAPRIRATLHLAQLDLVLTRKSRFETENGGGGRKYDRTFWLSNNRTIVARMQQTAESHQKSR